MRDWRRPVVTIAAATIAVDVLMLITGMGPQVVLVGALGVLIGVVAWTVADLATLAASSDGVASRLSDAPTARVDRRVTRLRSGLAYGRKDDASFDRLHATLVELIDDQLLVAHDIDRRRDPDAARAVLGPDLDRFVSDPDAAGTLVRPRTVDHIVTLIERL